MSESLDFWTVLLECLDLWAFLRVIMIDSYLDIASRVYQATSTTFKVSDSFDELSTCSLMKG